MNKGGYICKKVYRLADLDTDIPRGNKGWAKKHNTSARFWYEQIHSLSDREKARQFVSAGV